MVLISLVLAIHVDYVAGAMGEVAVPEADGHLVSLDADALAAALHMDIPLSLVPGLENRVLLPLLKIPLSCVLCKVDR